MQKLSTLLAALVLLATMACQKENDPDPISEQKQRLMAADWGGEQVVVETDYVMTTPNGQVPVQQEQIHTGFMDRCESAITARFLADGNFALTYLPGFCGKQQDESQQMRWRSDAAVTEITFIGENAGGMNIDPNGNYGSISNEATFEVLELTDDRLVITRSMPITDFFSQDLLDLYASQGITFSGTYTYTTTYLAR
ncbi:hypothetical protein [Cesiribacter andamanensis]|uniref:Lipocalin-like domain-containing protein n=1 Tax=Cesiribacter andamanensis AMV16 TaxID=1279009 RepID=M7N6A5_9BACT|nr:hypothetical protein [Cesiribacter andamanensis]EMR04163.1 hypothetical protein ADICEAN_00687 [Cesiribacter andamanensis AMV16]